MKIAIAQAVLLIAALASGGANAQDSGDLKRIQERGSLRMLCFPHVGGTFITEVTPGKFDGFDYAVMKALAASLHVRLEVKPVSKFEDVIPALIKGDGDVIASALTILEDRKKLVDFSIPYFPSVLFVVTSKTSKIAKFEDLKGRKGSVVKGSSHELRMKEITSADLHYVRKFEENMDALTAGEADFAFVDSTAVFSRLRKYPNLKAAFRLNEPEYFGYAVRSGSELRPLIDKHIRTLRGNAMMSNLIQRYLGDEAVKTLKVMPMPTE